MRLNTPAMVTGLAALTALTVSLVPLSAMASPPPSFFWGLPSAVWEYGGPALSGVGMAQSYAADGRFTVFESNELLTPEATGHQRHVYRRTVSDGSIALVSQRVRTDAPFGASYNPSISADGNLIAFETTDAGLFAEDPTCPGCIQIALADVTAGTVSLVSRPRGSVAPGDEGDSTDAMVSADGSRVVFTSRQPGMSNKGATTRSRATIESWNRSTGDITGVTGGIDAAGHSVAANGPSDSAAISSDGRYIAFSSTATNLGVPQVVVPDPPASGATAPVQSRVYRWDAQTGTTVLVSTSVADDPDSATQTDGDSSLPSISGDGDRIAFISGATNLIGSGEVPKSANHMTDAYVRILSASTTHRVSVVMVDRPRPDLADSRKGNPSMMRSRSWFEPWVSTTRVSLAADGLSAVLTSMNPLVEIHGDCMSCQTFQDNNNALDVFQVRLTADGRPMSVQPVSLKRDNQAYDSAISRFTLDSSTGGGDSIADGKTPTTADGSQIAFSSQAGDLRGVSGSTIIEDSGPPDYRPVHSLPVYVDGGIPDESPEPIRTFTVAANAFNSHLDPAASLRAKLAAQPLDEIRYETRSKAQLSLASAPAATTATSFLSPATVVPGDSGIVYGLSVNAQSAGSAEVVLDLDQLSLESEASIPSYWTRAASDAPNTLTYRTTLMNAGDSAVFSLHLKSTDSMTSAISVAVNATVNGIPIATTAAARLAPAKPSCILPPGELTVVADLAVSLKGAQCTAAKSTLKAVAAHGTATINASGVLIYRADRAFTGADTISVTAVDGLLRASAPIEFPVTVRGVASAADDAYSVLQNTTLTAPAPQGILANDTFTGGSGSWLVQEGNAPLHGKLQLDDNTGAFTFTADRDYVGDVTFKYLLRGTGWAEGARSTIATMTIHILEK